MDNSEHYGRQRPPQLTLAAAYSRAVGLFNTAAYAQAEQLCNTILKDVPNHVASINLIGVVAQITGRHDLAVEQFRLAIDLDRKFPNLQYNLGISLSNLERYEAAIIAFRNALAQDPDNSQINGNLGVVLEKVGKIGEAILCLKKAIALDPENYETCFNLGNTLKNHDLLEEAATCYRQTLSLKSDHFEALCNLGDVLARQEHYVEGISCLQQAIAIKPNVCDAYYNLGIILSNTGDFAGSARCYQKALDINQEFSEAYNNLGYVLTKQNQLDLAIENLEKALAINPGFPAAHYNLGVALTEQGRLEEAVACYQKAIAIKPDYPEVYNDLAITMKKQGKTRESIELYEKAIAIKPDYPEAHYNLGLALTKQGRSEEAMRCYQKAIFHKPDYPGANISMAIFAWLANDLHTVGKCLSAIRSTIDSSTKSVNKFVLPYNRLLSELLEYKNYHSEEYASVDNLPTLYVVGESHCLPAANTVVTYGGVKYRVQSRIIIGCKAWHLANNESNKYKQQFELIADSIPDGQTVILMFGEIDCRVDEGIIKHHRKTNNNNIYDAVESLVKDYIDYVFNVFTHKHMDVIVCGVAAISVSDRNLSAKNVMIWTKVVKFFNKTLHENALAKKIQFMDLYLLTNNRDKKPRRGYFIDSVHLFPSTFIDAVGMLLNGKN